MADYIAPEIRIYQESFIPPRPAEMLAMEAYAREHRFPIIGPAAGHFCYQIARIMGARQIFEMGSGYGYSTAWFARAVKENGGGTVHHVVWDEALSQRARRHLAALNLADVVEYHVSEAIEQLQATPGPFDLIFNDIDKAAYPAALPIVKEKLRPGGVLIVDNMIWGGQVFDPSNHDPSTEGIRQLAHMIRTDSDWIASLVAVRDGLLLAYKT